MRRHALVVILALAGGCTIGGGTTTVGIWRPKRTTDTTVCIQRQPDSCERVVEITRDAPARSFGGALVSIINPGYLRISSDLGTEHGVMLVNYAEYLRGRGALAVGLRAGANIGITGDHQLFSFPITALGYYGFDRLSLYGGVGYTPAATLNVPSEVDEMGEPITETMQLISTHGPNALAGGRYILRPGSINFTLSFELMHQMMFDMSATSATLSMGLHL